MRKVERYVTSDGAEHPTYEAAKRHADKRYGDLLTKTAARLVRIDKYVDMIDALDGLKGTMQSLLDLSGDLRVENPGEDED